MNIEVITNDYGSMGRVIGSELHIIVESQRIENAYSDKSNAKELEERLIKRAEKLKKEIEIAMRIKELIKGTLKEYDESEHQINLHDIDCWVCLNYKQLQSLVDEANSYIMKETSET